MTAHSSFTKWLITDPIPEGLLEDIYTCVDINVELAKADCFNCYAILCSADQIIDILTNLYANPEIKPRIHEEIEITASSCPHYNNYKTIAEYVIKRLNEKELKNNDICTNNN